MPDAKVEINLYSLWMWQSMTLELNASDDRGIDIVKQVFIFSSAAFDVSSPHFFSVPKEIKDFAGTRTIFG
jgi:hypothetical protein